MYVFYAHKTCPPTHIPSRVAIVCDTILLQICTNLPLNFDFYCDLLNTNSIEFQFINNQTVFFIHSLSTSFSIRIDSPLQNSIENLFFFFFFLDFETFLVLFSLHFCFSIRLFFRNRGKLACILISFCFDLISIW